MLSVLGDGRRGRVQVGRVTKELFTCYGGWGDE